MEELKTFFFDSYALYEIINGNPSYNLYSKDIQIVTTKLNLMELHYGLLRIKGEKEADKYYDYFLQFCVEISDDIIKQANEFRLNNYKRELSYIDCLGYIIAKKRGFKFLTGDEQFKDFDNVEFVK